MDSKTRVTVAVTVLSFCACTARAGALDFTPDPKLQAQLQQVMDVQERDNPLERYRRALALRAAVGETHDEYQRLISNMCYFAKGGDTGVRSGGRVVTFHYLVRMLKLNQPLVVGCSLSYLAAHPDDENLRWFVKTEVLRADDPDPDARPDVDELAAVIRSYNEGVQALVMEVMYARNPQRALERVVSVYMPDPQVARSLLWIARSVADAHWQFTHEVLRSEDYETALAGLEKIAASEQWWQRLYVAEVLWHHDEFRQPDLLARLWKDPHPIVVDVAKRMSYQADLPKRSARAPAQAPASAPATNETAKAGAAFPPPVPANERAREQTQEMIGATALMFGLGLGAGDGALVSALLWSDNDPDRQIARAAADRLAAEYALLRAVCTRTGGDPEVVQREMEQCGVAPPDLMAMLMAQGSYKVEGDRATVENDDERAPLPNLRNVSGIWKIDVTPSVIAGAPKDVAATIRQQAAALRTVVNDLQSGKLRTLEEVKAALVAHGLMPASKGTNQ